MGILLHRFKSSEKSKQTDKKTQTTPKPIVT